VQDLIQYDLGVQPDDPVLRDGRKHEAGFF